MKIITCAGYYRTGSSAISDLFCEFENCTSLGDYEFRFVQDPDGISDLEYNLLENNHRHNTSHAIKRFIKMIKFLNGSVYSKRYKRFFDNKFYEYSMEYIENITQLKCKAWWHRDQIDKGKIFYFLDRVYAKSIGLVQKGRGNTSMLHNEDSYFTYILKEEFYKYTREYIEKLFLYANRNNNEFLVADQLVPPSNINRYLNYFTDIKVICVERDPRDLYVLERTKYRWGIMPYENVKEFCDWYTITRAHRKKEIPDPGKVMLINFEDLIYQYETTVEKIINFVGLNKKYHTKKKSKFIPEKSKNNTKVYLKYPALNDDIIYIEKELEGYLYDFPND